MTKYLKICKIKVNSFCKKFLETNFTIVKVGNCTLSNIFIYIKKSRPNNHLHVLSSAPFSKNT